MAGALESDLRTLIGLLRSFGHTDMAGWLEERVAAVMAGDVEVRQDVRHHLVGGMGSVFDAAHGDELDLVERVASQLD